MDIKVRLNKNFTTAYNRMSEKYGEEIAYLNGFGDKQLSYTDFIDNFIDKDTVADISVDGNSNVSNKDMRTLMNEMPKPHRKLLAYNKIYYELNKRYGFKTANDWLEKEWTKALYMHDADTSTYIHYCFAYDLKDVAERGLFFLNNFNAEPPKHLSTFVDFVKEFISFASNRSSGAVGLPNIIPYMYYFWKKDCENGYATKSPEYYARQQIQRFVYSVNQPYTRDGMQSAFTNCSIFDMPYLEALFGGAEFPDGTFMIDSLKEIQNFQKLFMEVIAEIRQHNMFTFPVLTISLLRKDGKFIDEDFARWGIEHNRIWSDSNLFIDDSVNSLSNCPLSPDTKILYWSDYYKQYKLSPIKDVYNNRTKDGKEPKIKVLSNGQEINCKINRFEIAPEYEITLINGAKIKTTANHLNKVYGKDYVKTEDLTCEDYLPYGLHAYEINDNLTYEEGKIIGAFLGDGSYSENGIVLSLNSKTDRDFMDWLHDYIPKYFDGECTENLLTSQISGESHCINFRITSLYLLGLIHQYVIGDSALTKTINLKVLNCSKRFRQGIIDGWIQTDGGNSNRIYSSSLSLIENMNVVFTSLGLVTRIDEDNRENRLSKNACYTLRYYTPGNRKRLKDTYIIDKDYMWIKIKSITRCKTKATTSYCLEVLEDVEPIFMLGNGIITHNCRLKSNIEDLGYFNSIGGTALKVGSVKVSTINLARLALEHPGDIKSYLEALDKITLLDCQVLDVVRNIIKRNVEKELLPNFSKGIVDFEHLYNTIGVIGIYETMKTFGFTTTDKLGNVYYTKQADEFGKLIFEHLHKVKNDFAADKDYKINCEQIPGESAAAKMQLADEFFFPDMVVKDLPLYGNQFIPLGIKTTMQERIRIASLFDSYCNGGSIAHLNIDAPFDSFEKAWDAVNYIADQGLTYFAFNTKIQVCAHNHAFYGKKCPVCGGEVATEYTRIVGFYTPIKTWSKERKEEFKLRQWEHINES